MVHSSTNVKLAKAAGQPGPVHTLTDMDVEEVSMVDRAANKKKFLVIKAAKGPKSMSTEVQPNGKGGFSSTQKNRSSTKKKLEVPPGYKEMASPLLTKASEMLDQLASDLSSSSAADVGDDGTIPGVPPDFTNAITQVCGLLDKVSTMMPAAAPDPEDDAAQGGADEATEPTEMQMRAAADNFAKIFGGKVTKATVLKVGAKMAKERFTQLQQAYTTLGNLIQQLAPAAAPTGAPTIGKAKDGEEEKKKAEKSESPELMRALSALTQSVSSIASVVKTQGNELAALRKSRMGGASAVVEDTPAAEPKAFSWPMDMSNPITRETVGKNEGFFDD